MWGRLSRYATGNEKSQVSQPLVMAFLIGRKQWWQSRLSPHFRHCISPLLLWLAVRGDLHQTEETKHQQHEEPNDGGRGHRDVLPCGLLSQ
jgi:hypothetical protein